jgi:hypothetical protein
MRAVLVLWILGYLASCSWTRAIQPSSLSKFYQPHFLIGSAVNAQIVKGQDATGQAILLKQFCYGR